MTPLNAMGNNVSEPKSEKPNILVLITDQQWTDHLGFIDNQVVNNPNLDQLAGRSTVLKKQLGFKTGLHTQPMLNTYQQNA